MNSIWEWIIAHSGFLTTTTNLLMLFVWVFYAHLLYRQYRYQNHPRLMIHQAPNNSIDSLSLVVNMSEKLINVVSIILVGYNDEKVEYAEVSDYWKMENINEQNSSDIRSFLKRGPLASGEYIVIGSFRKLLDNLNKQKKEETDFHRIEIRIAMLHSKENMPIGATRSFDINKTEGGHFNITPSTFHTKQMITFWERKKVSSWFKGHYTSTQS